MTAKISETILYVIGGIIKMQVPSRRGVVNRKNWNPQMIHPSFVLLCIHHLSSTSVIICISGTNHGAYVLKHHNVLVVPCFSLLL